MNFIWFIIIGGVAGWLAEKIMKKDMNIWQNIGIGILGGIVGGWLFSLLGFDSNTLIGSLITALVGAIVLIWLWNFIKNRSK
jgi:uncharacterized membrane protein YeaQ/YmgE (transglycosylase-associated protein family)